MDPKSVLLGLREKSVGLSKAQTRIPWREIINDCIEEVTCGGESGEEARICDYAWILNTMMQCVECNVSFHFKQTGAKFKRGNRVYQIDRKDQLTQARKAGIDFRAAQN